MSLVIGPAGSGKTASALRYREEQPLITANGQSPVLYFQLSRGEENHKAFYHRVIEAIVGDTYRKRGSAADMVAESRRLIQKYGYELLICDEVGFLNHDGLEAARTLNDLIKIPIVFIGMPGFQEQVERTLPQFFSRITEVLEYGLLSQEMIKYDVLPNISEQSHIQFDPDHKNADKMVATLFEGTGGSDGLGARIREVAQILFRCHLLIQESIDIREQCIANGERPKKIRPFNDALIAEAVKKSKRRGKQGRKRS
jgi:DNA transposition AAA+ family ATPase